MVALLYGEQTIYSQGYTEAAFRKVKGGDAKESIFIKLGHPLRTTIVNRAERWRYSSLTRSHQGKLVKEVELDPNVERFTAVEFDLENRVMSVKGQLLGHVESGTPQKEILKRYGKPVEITPREIGIWLEYSIPADQTNKTHQVRRILIDERGTVLKIQKELYVD